MESQKIYLPMAHSVWRTYAVTLKEQQDLASKFGLKLDQVRTELRVLMNRLIAGEIAQQKTATKMKKVINAHFESSNATERQGA